MSKQRTLRLECGKPNQVIYVLGTVLNIDIYKPAPLGSQSFEVRCSPGVKCSISDLHNITVAADNAKRWTLNNGTLLVVTMEKISNDLNDNKVTIIFYGDKLDKPIDKIILQLTAVYISLDVDADRDGKVEKNNPNKGSWKWGPNGHGAVLLVNSDKEAHTTAKYDTSDDTVPIFEDLTDMSQMILRTEGPKFLPPDYKLQLHISASDAKKVQVFHHDLTKMTKVLCTTMLSSVMDYTKGNNEYNFFVEGLTFPDEAIGNLVTFNLSLLEPMIVGCVPIFTEHVVFFLAPWIMTPNTLAPQEVFVCSLKDNAKFLKEFTAVVEKAKCKLTICSEDVNRDDPWIQDEIEFGYSEAPHKTFPVVFDSPRNGGLEMFPYKELLGPDFGHVTRTADIPSSLDSFGNLEVSPPVTVNGKEYPMGRIIIGNAIPNISDTKMTKAVRDFLYAQTVQPLIELFSDWLYVGHVDEFLTFVPAPDRKGFRLLLASPDACCKLFMKLQQEGHGEAQMFESENINANPVKINEILSNEKLREDNAYVQQWVDWNRDVLKKELGLDEEDIIDIPVLFEIECLQRAGAFFPDMVNMIVLGKYLGIPKPFGPLVNGKCPLESAVRSALEPLGLDCNFIDDFAPYHKNSGEVHCGSNVLRKPFAFKWWDMEI